MKRAALVTLLALALAAAFAPPVSATSQEIVYQVSTIENLLAGGYDGVASLFELAGHGDIGLGTFDALDGEMVVADGVFYRISADGRAHAVKLQESSPFAAVTFFTADEEFALSGVHGLDALQAALMRAVADKGLFYAIRIEGSFDRVKVRSVPRQERPFRRLVEVVKDQPEFVHEKIPGVLVGFYCPEAAAGFNVPGFHLHFLSADKSVGGHLLDVDVAEARVGLDETGGFFARLPRNGAALSRGAAAQGELDAVER